MLPRNIVMIPAAGALILALFIPISGRMNEQEGKSRVSGVVTDFEGHALGGVSVILKDRQFKDLYRTLSGKDGRYSLSVPKDTYYCLIAVREPEYRVSKLEYWAWNVPVYGDIEIDPQYDRMEIYGINIFEPQVTPQETYMVYFRPMSLTKTLKIVDEQKIDVKKFESEKRAEGLLRTARGEILNLSPDSLTPEEISMEVNGIKAEILGITKTIEYGRGVYLYGYVVQIKKPKGKLASIPVYDRITIKVRSTETGEAGKGEAFIKR